MPLERSVPSEQNHSAPFSMIRGTLTQVSTLLSTVGLSHSPLSVAWTYLARGSPTLPSTERISAEDSPQTKAPPPRLISMSKEKPLPRMLSPSSPRARASAMARCRCSTARGYSWRT